MHLNMNVVSVWGCARWQSHALEHERYYALGVHLSFHLPVLLGKFHQNICQT